MKTSVFQNNKSSEKTITNIKNNYTAQQLTQQLGLQKGIFNNSLSNTGAGTAILQTSNRWTITEQEKGIIQNRVITATIKSRDKTQEFCLINIYGPAKENQRATFYNQFSEYLNKSLNNKKLIIGGDFNLTLEEKDHTNFPRKNTSILRQTRK